MRPASLRLIRDDDVPRFMGAKKVSMHQAGFQEVLASALLSGDLPEHIALLGVQPELLDDYGGSLTAGVRAQVDVAVDLARDVLDAWGIIVQDRDRPIGDTDRVGPGALDIADYEAGRPVIGEGL